MTFPFHDAVHRSRAEQFEYDAAVYAVTRDVRRARRLERAARSATAVAAWVTRVSGRIEARASRARARAL